MPRSLEQDSFDTGGIRPVIVNSADFQNTPTYKIPELTSEYVIDGKIPGVSEKNDDQTEHSNVLSLRTDNLTFVDLPPPEVSTLQTSDVFLEPNADPIPLK